MVYIKAYDAEDVYIGADAIDEPVWCRRQVNSGRWVCCDEQDAQGIVSSDGNAIYLIRGQQPLGVKEPYAEIIDRAEYEALRDGVIDPEDEIEPEDPETPEILTRAELTARVALLEECLLEMSEKLYG